MLLTLLLCFDYCTCFFGFLVDHVPCDPYARTTPCIQYSGTWHRAMLTSNNHFFAFLYVCKKYAYYMHTRIVM